MTWAIFFWVLYLLGLFYCLWAYWPQGYRPSGVVLLIFVLIGLLAWKGPFGAPVH